ncbi:histone-lysine N-methyltransferase SETDB1-B-like [Pempheris klunzingeri]|uniref:histone-lysine N-methyltransferase SETDB1-B-like n=1 Tax=Pempheris klunzingeri TaxID=3127111 RepID=UPI00397FC64B
MEGDEREMTKEEFQKWIRKMVKKSGLISTNLLEKCSLLQSLLQKREERAAHLLKLCESVVACEATVKKQYSLLGWEYRDADSDDDNQADCGNTAPSPRKFVPTETEVLSPPTTSGLTPLLTKLKDLIEAEDHSADNIKKNCMKRRPVVVLTRLTTSMIKSLCLRKSPNNCSEDESSDIWESDYQPEDDSSDSEYSVSDYEYGPNKRRRIAQKSNAKPQASTKTDAQSKTAKTSTLQANVKSEVTKTSPPQTNRNTNECKPIKTSTSPATANGVTPVCTASTLCQKSDKAIKTHPEAPQGEICVNMSVLARQSDNNWKRGKVMDIVTKDGRLKYKIHFEEKKKSLVSAHHIGFDSMPKLDQLVVGARVVVKWQKDQVRFCPGVLAEVPNRKNRMRFLVFCDDNRPMYVGLPLLHLVFRPLPDPLDDVPDEAYKKFLKDYMKVWPYPPQTHYRVGQTINAELNGVQQRCEVLVVDSSLIEVVFERDQHKEWIYRGSPRLEHMINMMKECLEFKQ